MNARKRTKSAPGPLITRLAVRLEGHDVRIDADINVIAKYPQHALQTDDADPVYKYVTRLTLQGTVTYPSERAGDRYTITVTGDDSPSRQVSPTLKQLQDRDQYGAPKYRPYRGGQIPAYRTMPGLGLVDKVRGEPAWSGWANVEARLVSDMLVLLGTRRDLYHAVEERKIGRTRWIDGVGLQTTDPADD